MEQLNQGHIQPSTSPWNTPIFVIKKKLGNFRLLQDLRAVNQQMEPMGALQPGLPNPAMLPRNWPLLIIDLKDCFFTIPLHPQDTKRFAFTLPALNKGEPDKRFEWKTLPQGMRNSPTLCQLYVDMALQPVRRMFPTMIIYHYMDDILCAQDKPFSNLQVQNIITHLQEHGLVVSSEKIQLQAPWKYLGWTITDQQIRPQNLCISTHPSTLHEAQKLMGDLQWLKPVVGLPNSLLEALRPLLKGTDPCAPVTLTPQQINALQKLTHLIAEGFVSRYEPSLPISLTIWNNEQHLLGAVTQVKKAEAATQSMNQDMVILEWITPPLQQRKTITQKLERLATLIKKGHMRIIEITGREPVTIHLPMDSATLNWYLLNSAELTEALLQSPATVVSGPLCPKSLRWLGQWDWMTIPLHQNQPISDAITAFTDAGKKSQKAAVTWKEGNRWNQHIILGESQDNLQTLELLAVIWAFQKFLSPVNIVSDSLYVVGVVVRIEDATIRDVANPRLGTLFMQLQRTLRARRHPYAIIHIRSHKWNEGLGEGNARADQLVSVGQHLALPKTLLAKESHEIFHQNAKGLAREFQLPLEEARAVVKACSICSHHNDGVGLGTGVNPKGLGANEVWQMDVTHVPDLGRLKYVHVTIDTFSHFIWATAQTGEQALHVERHLHSCIAVMGVPQTIKTDNGPAYCSQKVKRFMQTWNIKHARGIPHVPTGQAVVERAHGTLKRYLQKYQNIKSPLDRLLKCLFVLNHLCIFGDQKVPPVIVHFQGEERLAPPMFVRYRDPKTGIRQDPAKVLYWGRGYLCVSTPTGTVWVPARWTKPVTPAAALPDS